MAEQCLARRVDGGRCIKLVADILCSFCEECGGRAGVEFYRPASPTPGEEVIHEDGEPPPPLAFEWTEREPRGGEVEMEDMDSVAILAQD